MSPELNDLLQHESPAEVAEILQLLLDECTSDSAPNAQEVQQWQSILQQRGGKFIKLAQMCQNYLNETNT